MGRAADGSVRNLSEASGLSKKKVEQSLKTKLSYTKFGPPIRRFRRLQAFSKNQGILVYGLGICGQTSESNIDWFLLI